MNYQETLQWMFSQLPMYQRVGKQAYKANLDNTLLLDRYLKQPHNSYPTIHVAGTNGKGSTCHMIASILQQAGYKVGLYTSPHLKDFRERIRVNGIPCSEQYVTSFIDQHRTFLEQHKLSFFEMTVGMAFDYFKQQQVDIAVIETGLGGRLDSTNIIQPLVSVITAIDKDHTAILGNTLSKIASEKAGIIKSNTPVVVGERRGWLRARFRESAIRQNASFYAVDHRVKAIPSDLTAAYQKDNSRTAVTAIKVLTSTTDFHVLDHDIQLGLSKVISSTGLRGRYEVLSTRPRVIIDTAHNPAGIKSLLKQLQNESYKHLHIVIGLAADKDASQLVTMLPEQATYFLCQAKVPRAMSVQQLATYFKDKPNVLICTKSVSAALQTACGNAKEGDLVLVTGSVFVIAEII